MDAGFNGARLHQKVFEERFLYHADRLGYLVWGEFADWGCGGLRPRRTTTSSPARPTSPSGWRRIERDYSHPSIVGWCPLNETWQTLRDRITVLDDVTRGHVPGRQGDGHDPAGAGHVGLRAPRAGDRCVRLPRLLACGGLCRGTRPVRRTPLWTRAGSALYQPPPRRAPEETGDVHTVPRAAVLPQ